MIDSERERYVDVICAGDWDSRLIGLYAHVELHNESNMRLATARAASVARWSGMRNLDGRSLSGEVTLHAVHSALLERDATISQQWPLPDNWSSLLEEFDTDETRQLDFWRDFLTRRGMSWSERPTVPFSRGDGWGTAVTRCPLTGERAARGEYYRFSDWNLMLRLDPTRLDEALPAHQVREIAELAYQHESACHYPIALTFAVTRDNIRTLHIQPQTLGSLEACATAIADLGASAIASVDIRRIQVATTAGLSDAERTRLRLTADQLRVRVHGTATGAPVFADVADTLPIRDEKSVVVARELHPGLTEHLDRVAAVAVEYLDPSSHLAILLDRDAIPVLSGISYESCLRELETEEFVTIDSAAAALYAGRAVLEERSPGAAYFAVLSAAREVTTLQVLANADTGDAARAALKNGALGIGLARTEHLFVDELGRRAISRLLRTGSMPGDAFDYLYRRQLDVFRELLSEMRGLPVKIRLLDAPSNEFVAAEESIAEDNPMMGFRGVRLLITYPLLLEVQCRAIAEATRVVGSAARPEIMLPMVATAEEVTAIVQMIRAHHEWGCAHLPVGVMLETPRACIAAAAIVEAGASFVSFGTNDLTQFTYALSRTDAGSTISAYSSLGILPGDPFDTIDLAGVGHLMRAAIRGARAVRADCHVSVCGQQAFNADSIADLIAMEVDSISGSAANVATAWVASGRAAALRL